MGFKRRAHEPLTPATCLQMACDLKRTHLASVMFSWTPECVQMTARIFTNEPNPHLTRCKDRTLNGQKGRHRGQALSKAWWEKKISISGAYGGSRGEPRVTMWTSVPGCPLPPDSRTTWEADWPPAPITCKYQRSLKNLLISDPHFSSP